MQPIARVRIHVPISGINVPSLGPVVDSFLDAWGYDSELIQILYAQYRKSDTAEEFAAGVRPWVPYTEALWYWLQIVVPSPPHPRVRNLPWVDSRRDRRL